MRLSNRWISGMVLMLMASGVSFGETMPESADGRVDGGAKMLREARLLPVKLAHEISPDQLRPIPDGMPVRRYIVGQGLLDGEVAGGTGTEIYRNTLGEFLYPPGAGVMVADDLRTVCASSELTWIEIEVAGGGDGTGPGFDAEFQLYDNCPSATNNPGDPIAGTFAQATFPDDGNFLLTLDLSSAPVQIPSLVWLGVTLSTASAGWTVGASAEIGSSEDIFDGPFPCTTDFGGSPPNPHGSFFAQLLGQNCQSVFLAYESDAFSGFFTGLALSEQFADDVLPISAPGICDVVQYEVELAGLDGGYTMSTELWSHDETSERPFAPILGSVGIFGGDGNGFLEVATHEFSPPIPTPTPSIWITYDVDGHEAGPILASDFPSVGFSDDCFSIFSNPDPGLFSQCVWMFGGCPQNVTGNPCGTFNASVYCAGTEPAGACCDVVTPDTPDCVDNVPTTHCGGRLVQNETCAVAQFDPPCGAGSCCKPDETCENLTDTGCEAVGGLWQAGQFCGVDEQSCPPAACVTATNACDVISSSPGCNDPFCCDRICGIDDFCCAVAWDETCVGNASGLCPQPPIDECVNAIEISCGESIVLDNRLATNVVTDPGYSCHSGGSGNPGIGSVWAKFTATSTSLQVSTCNSVPPADDSLLAVYSGTCGALTEIGCSDDALGCAATDFNSEICLNTLAIGNTYYIQLSTWTEADRGQYTIDMQCPAPLECDPNPVIGACCFSDGTCSQTTFQNCPIGTWTSGQSCIPNACPQPGSCCRNDGSCTVSLETACGDGVWSLAGSCAPNACPPTGACCAMDGACSIGFQSDCASGVWTLGGTCSPSQCAMPPIVTAVGSRYLAVTPDGASAMPVSLAVTSGDHPCLNKYVDANGLLRDDPLFRTALQWGTVYVGDEEIVPDSTYRITVDNGVSVAQSVGVTTWKWGDVNHSGAVNLDDILCLLAGFAGEYGDCTLYGVDLIGGFFNPDRTVTLDDILAVLSAFGGAAYPGDAPCP